MNEHAPFHHITIHNSVCMCMCYVCGSLLSIHSLGSNISVFNNLQLCSQIIQDGWTALMLASLNGRTDIVELLIKHNADVNARTKVSLHTRDSMHMTFTCI